MSNNYIKFLKKHLIFKHELILIFNFVIRIKWLVSWFVQRVTDLSVSHKKQRLLIIYDLTCQPFSVGDVLVVQEAALVLREKYDVQYVDFAIVYDSEKVSPNQVFSSITKDNVFYNIPPLLSAAQVNKYLGSLFLFNSHSQAYRFMADNAESYHIWPSGRQIAMRDYVYYQTFNELLYSYFEKNKTIPKLSSRQFISDWATNFIAETVYPDIPITINLRNNKCFGTNRNSVFESWLIFFEYCEGRFPAKFIIICSISEIDDRFRKLSNVIFSKDYYTNTEQELSLIENAEFHMGASSGMATIALFNSKPFLIVNSDLVIKDYRGIIKDGNFLRFFFSTSLQQFAIGKETPELLIAEFLKMWKTIDVETCRESTYKSTVSKDKLHSWLR